MEINKKHLSVRFAAGSIISLGKFKTSPEKTKKSEINGKPRISLKDTSIFNKGTFAPELPKEQVRTTLVNK